MTELIILIKRNIKLFFKDKGMFFTSLITPLILLVLYATFLADVYHDSFSSALPAGFGVPEELIDGVVGAQLFSSLLAVCCVTVAFCSNMLMVQDRVTGVKKDFDITPVKRSTLSLGYYVATLAVSLLICLVATAACLIYIAVVGWYMSAADILLLLVDIFLLVTFGTALSSVINFFLTSQGQLSAVGTVVSAGYGFICGAYMPISQFGETLQRIIAFLPGTYGTSLLRNHALRGAFAEMEAVGIPAEVVEGVKDSIDCNIYFFEHSVDVPVMYAVLCASIAVLVLAYVLINVLVKKRV